MSDSESVVNRDTTQKSRKGRKPKHSVAMTAAERKRHQRQREREAKAELPRWLRLRRQLWQVVQREFMFANADELGHALDALAIVIMNSNYMMGHTQGSRENRLGYWMMFNDPTNPDISEATRIGVNQFFPELKPYSWEAGNDFPNAKDTRLVHVICDILGSHETVSDTEATEATETHAND